MNPWQKLGDPDMPIYRRTLDPKAMFGVERVDVTETEEGTLIIAIWTKEGTISMNLHRDDR